MLYDDALILLINTSLNFILKNNTIPTTLIFYNEQADAEVVDLFHSIKADYIEGVFYIMRTIFMQFKDAKMIQANPILSNPALIPSFINSLS
jgi:Ni,Fe-hydrogenase I cytochrome b subunit